MNRALVNRLTNDVRELARVGPGTFDAGVATISVHLALLAGPRDWDEVRCWLIDHHVTGDLLAGLFRSCDSSLEGLLTYVLGQLEREAAMPSGSKS